MRWPEPQEYRAKADELRRKANAETGFVRAEWLKLAAVYDDLARKFAPDDNPQPRLL